MNKILVVLTVMTIFISIIFVGCDQVIGSGDLETEEYSFSDFKKVEIGSAFKFDIRQSDTYSVSITADDNVIDDVKVSKSGDTLKIDLSLFGSLGSVTLEAEITMPQLVGLDISGASRGSVSGFSSSDNIDIELSGASRLTGDITAGDIDIEASGASNIELTGSAGNLVADVSGASRCSLDDFPVNDADVEFSGASSGTINLSGRLDADISGASRLYYIGEPTMGNVNTSGASSLSKR